MTKLCSIDGCEKKQLALGLCCAHYTLKRRNGDPHIRKRNKNGDGWVSGCGYRTRTENCVTKMEHIMVAEVALGKQLPNLAVVHHVNEVKTDNRNENLVICPNQAYHRLIHQRTDAYNACGNANWRKCKRCFCYGDPDVMAKDGNGFSHKLCKNLYQRKMYAIKKSQMKRAA